MEKRIPSNLHHHEGQTFPIDEVGALIEKASDSADIGAILALDASLPLYPVRIVGIAVRECPPLPPTIAERITS